jgi:hypothetical protein
MEPFKPDLSPLETCLLAFSLSSLGGFAAFLRGTQQVTTRAVLAALVYTGAVGLLIALAWYNYYGGKEHFFFMLFVSLLAGLGGTSAAGFIINSLKGTGINIVISPADAEPKTPSPKP